MTYINCENIDRLFPRLHGVTVDLWTATKRLRTQFPKLVANDLQ